MKKIIGRNREVQQFRDALESWQKDEPLWIHFQGDVGCGKTHLINFISDHILKDFHLLYKQDSWTFPFDHLSRIKMILRHIYQNFPNEFEAFLGNYSHYLRNAITKLFQTNIDANISDSYSPQFFLGLLLQLLSFFSTQIKIFFIFENLSLNDNQQIKILSDLLNSTIPILIITSGPDEIPNENKKIQGNLIKIDRMSVVDIQDFVSDYFSIREENARFIANHIHVKSQGNPVKIKFLLEAYFQDIIPLNQKDMIDPQKLQKIRISSDPEIIFSSLEEKLSKAEISIFSFLSHLFDPLPETILKRIIKQFKLDKSQIAVWIEKNYINRVEFAGEKFVSIKWDLWMQHLRKNIEVKETLKILVFLRNNSILKKLKFPLQLSHLYFDIRDKKTALQLAHEEGRILRQLEFNQRAYESYNFVKRNLSDYPKKESALKVFFKEMGELQKSLGLYENAFESFLELRNRLGRADQKEWFNTSLQMAEILLEMDAFAEAKYLLNDLKIKKVANAFTKSYSIMLLGDLDMNLSHNDYALAKYQQALALADKVKDPEFIYRLYSKIRKIQLDNRDYEEIKDLSAKMLRLLPKESRYYFLCNLDLLKLYVSQKEFEPARNLALQMFRKLKHKFDPAIMAQTILYLVDIYAFYSKWYLAKSHLSQLMKMKLLLTNEKIRVRILINLAVIEKEIAHYGEALRLLLKAEGICKNENFVHEQNEIKIHKGHIQMLIHGYLRQREYLAGALQWSIENQDHELFIMASLYLSSYELQQKRYKKVKKHLNEAYARINLTRNEVDRLNYVFYFLQYLLAIEDLRWTDRIVRIWENNSQGIAKFENLIIWFKAKLAAKNGDHKTALKEYKLCLERSRRYKLPHFEFHVLKEIIILCHHEKLKKEYQKFVKQLKSTFNNLLEAIDDEILKKQFHESREVEELRKIEIRLE